MSNVHFLFESCNTTRLEYVYKKLKRILKNATVYFHMSMEKRFLGSEAG